MKEGKCMRKSKYKEEKEMKLRMEPGQKRKRKGGINGLGECRGGGGREIQGE